jgi:SagB-type dehydrogenase family enzyme
MITAHEYHRKTSYERNKIGSGGLDFGNQPNVFKSYPGRDTIPLPQVAALPEESFSDIVKDRSRPEPPDMDLDRLARIVVLTHAVTAKARYGGADFYFRNVASAGALYPFELYVGACNVSGLDDGLYHHSLGIHALTRLRSGDIEPSVSQAIDLEREGSLCLAFFLTSIFFRSSWKYRDRAYRYHLLDTGHLAENLTLALKALHMPFRIYYDFDDRKVNSLLGVDERREAGLAIIGVWCKEAVGSRAVKELEPAEAGLAEASWVSSREVDYPLIREVHAATAAKVEPGEQPPKMLDRLGLRMEPGPELPELDTWPEVLNYSEAVSKRRSSRNFVRSPLSADGLVALLESLCASSHEHHETRMIVRSALSVGFLAGNVNGLDPGFYTLDMENGSISLVSEGFMMDEMARVCLDQAWLRNCDLHFLFLSNLELLETTWGTRGYRLAMLTAGRLGQRIYLAATSMGMGCCGIGAFYDREAAELLGLNTSSALLYLVAAGPLKKRPGAWG